MHDNRGRILYLDGLRGLAILFVALFHAFAHWTTLVPYGDKYSDIAFFKYGWLGVELFFLISGYVILMTLEKCSSIRVFLYRRWLRLFPAMSVCSAIIFLTSSYFSERPAGTPNWESLLPGLTFLEPTWWALITGHKIKVMEGAFWSIYVEFKFYVFAALIYYWKGRNALILGLVLVFVVTTLLRIEENAMGVGFLKPLYSMGLTLSFKYFGWFASGAAFYVFSQNKSINWLAIALSIALSSAVAEGGLEWQKTIAACVVCIFFAASTLVKFIQNILRSRVILFFGLISYPFYLIHENMMISMIIKLTAFAKYIPVALIPFIAIAMISAISYVISSFFEPKVNHLLRYSINYKREIRKSAAGNQAAP